MMKTLIRKNLIHHKFRYIVTFLVILLVNIFVISSKTIVDEVNLGILDAKYKLGADAIVYSSSEDEKIESVLYNGIPVSTFVSNKFSDELSKIDGVTDVVKRVYLATLEEASCCDSAIQIIAIDYTNDVYLQAIAESKDLKDNEIILGSKINIAIGETVTYFGKEWVVKERLSKTNTGYDLSGFVNISAVKDTSKEYFEKDISEYSSMFFVGTNNAILLKNVLGSQYSKEVNVWIPDRKVAEYTSKIGDVSKILDITTCFIVIIGMLAVFSLGVLGTISRRNEVGTYLLIGKTPLFVRLLFTIEQLIVSLGATFTATGLIFLIKIAFRNALDSLNLPLVDDVGYTLLIALLTGLFGALTSVSSIYFAGISYDESTVSDLIKESS